MSTQNPKDTQNRIAIITGTGRDIGKETAIMLANVVENIVGLRSTGSCRTSSCSRRRSAAACRSAPWSRAPRSRRSATPAASCT